MITTTKLNNGLTVIVEEMDHVESASYDLLIPGGLIADHGSTVGASVILAELLSRGAGPYNSRELSDAFENLGVRHGEGTGLDKFAFGGSLVADKLEQALQLVAFMAMEPRLPEDEIPNIRSVLLQDIAALRDSPARRAGVELNARYYPSPFNRSSLGDAEGLSNTDRSTVAALHRRFFCPDRAILSVAGRVKGSAVIAMAERLFGKWTGTAEVVPQFTALSKHEYFPIEVESAQLQILFASPSVIFGGDGYYAGKIAVSLLGASMFGRLFVEVREKRGLCYSVYARHSANNSYGTVTAYVGTTPERAQESLDVLLKELQGLHGTVGDDELARAKVNIKASLVLGEESPGSRASSNATDWWLLGRIRPLAEVSGEIDRVDIRAVDSFLEQYPFRPASLLTLGGRRLEVADELCNG